MIALIAEIIAKSPLRDEGGFVPLTNVATLLQKKLPGFNSKTYLGVKLGDAVRRVKRFETLLRNIKGGIEVFVRDREGLNTVPILEESTPVETVVIVSPPDPEPIAVAETAPPIALPVAVTEFEVVMAETEEVSAPIEEISFEIEDVSDESEEAVAEEILTEEDSSQEQEEAVSAEVVADDEPADAPNVFRYEDLSAADPPAFEKAVGVSKADFDKTAEVLREAAPTRGPKPKLNVEDMLVATLLHFSVGIPRAEIAEALGVSIWSLSKSIRWVLATQPNVMDYIKR